MDSKAKYAFDVEAFQDVVPIKQYDGNPPILSLKYPPECTKCNPYCEDEQMMDVFRAIVLSGEVSERVYNLTYPVISSLPSNYNVWFVRRKCIFQLQKDLREEIKYLNSITPGNEKVYQIWLCSLIDY
jgi:protein farnesyltransferase/geranylgeranyltransferase type-1 subunit alpha